MTMRVLRRITVTATAAVVVLAASAARATVAPVCAGPRAVARPGPVAPHQAAVRLMPNNVDYNGQSDVAVRLVDASLAEIAVELEQLADRTYFVRAEQPLALGAYTLEYSDGCTDEVQSIALDIAEAPALPAALGELTARYSAYCSGKTFDTMFGPVVADFPPPVVVELMLAPELEAYRAFLTVRLQDDLGTEWLSGGPLWPWGSTGPIFASRPAVCSASSASVALGHRVMTASAQIEDGPALPPARAEVDVFCAECPPANPPSDPQPPKVPPPADNSRRAPSETACSVGAFGSSGSSVPSALVLLAILALLRQPIRCGIRVPAAR